MKKTISNDRVKFPKTFHFPWSPGLQNDDRVLEGGTGGWEGAEYVFTEKRDGEGTTMYRDYVHARSIEFAQHPSRTFIKALHGEVAHNIPDDLRVCGENLTAVHSIRYDGLSSYFEVFNIWNELTCLSWDETLEWAALLNLEHVPVIHRGPYSDALCRELCEALHPEQQEGLVARPARAFHMREYASVVGKYVRKGHVQTDQHWMKKAIEFNGLKEKHQEDRT